MLGFLRSVALGVLLFAAPVWLLNDMAANTAREAARVVVAESTREARRAPCPPMESLLTVWVSDFSYGTAWVAGCRPVLEGQPGFLVELVTAAHVVEGADATVRVQRGVEMLGHARVDYVDQGADVAVLILVLLNPMEPLELGDDAAAGDRVFAWGFPYTEPLMCWVREGVAAAPERHSAVTGPGSSGGPVLSSDGRVVGVVRGHWSHPALGMAACAPVSAVLAALEASR